MKHLYSTSEVSPRGAARPACPCRPAPLPRRRGLTALFRALLAAISAASLGLASQSRAAEKIEIVAPVEARLIPVSLSGFTGEVAKALKFDLLVQGFEI